MAYRNKTYVAFDGDSDMKYYRMLQAWKEHNDINFDFYDAHSINTARDSSLLESIKNQLRERLDNSKLFMILVGDKTKLNQGYIPWEIEQAKKRDLPIVVVYINGARSQDDSVCPVLLRNCLAIHIPFKAKIMQYALDNWPASFERHKAEDSTTSYYYPDSVYRNLGL